MPNKRAAKNPLKLIDLVTVRMGIDYAIETATVPADRETPCGVGYLRYAPAALVPLLREHWPHTFARWTGRRLGQPGRTVPREEVCFPIAYLNAFVAFLRLAGKWHVAPISRALPLDPNAVHDLDVPLPLDPDF